MLGLRKRVKERVREERGIPALQEKRGHRDG
jgi:hypothetical protein